RKIGFESGLLSIGQLGAQTNQIATALDQLVELAGQVIVGLPGTQFVPMRVEHVQQQLGIAWIVLGSAGIESLAEFGQRLGIDGKEDQMVILSQSIDQCAARLLQADGDFARAKALAQLSDPCGDGFGAMIKVARLDLIGAGCTQAVVMFLVGPVQTDEGGELSGSWRWFHRDCFFRFKPSRWPWLSEDLIAETCKVDILSIRFEPKRHAGSEGLSQNVATLRPGNSSSQRGVSKAELAQKSDLFPSI